MSGKKKKDDDTLSLPFDGDTFDAELDGKRLGKQLGAVVKLMRDRQWRTLEEIQRAIGFGSEASISARLRDLRKPKFGSHAVDRRRRGDPKKGLFEYRVHVGAA